jgi:hypothetical protein
MWGKAEVDQEGNVRTWKKGEKVRERKMKKRGEGVYLAIVTISLQLSSETFKIFLSMNRVGSIIF